MEQGNPNKASRQIKFIWFDLGYTLIRLEREPRYSRLLASLGVDIPADDLTMPFHYMDKIFMRDFPGVFGRDPRTYMPWYLGMLNYRLGISLNLLTVMNLWMDPAYNPRGHWQCYDDTLTTLTKLKSLGYRMGIISNWDHSARGIIREHGLEPYMDCIVISSEEGYEKPDRHVFDVGLSRAGVSPEECLYVGDNYYDDVIGSRRVGMDNLLLNRYGRDGIEEISDAKVIGSLGEIIDHLVNETTG